MNKQNTETLFRDFDRLYRGQYLSPTENVVCLGFMYGEGWYDIIYCLSERIAAYCQEHPEIDLIAMQIKEKFGQLRFYVRDGCEEIDRFIDEAEEQSKRTCELTGEPGVLCKRPSYYQTLSLEKAAELGFEPVSSPG